MKLRKVYTTPRIESYGRLRDLKAGGSGNANEDSQGQRPRP